MREPVQGKTAMSKLKCKARRELEVTIMFEPSRLAATYLADAYAQVVPLQSCSIPVNTRESPSTPLDGITFAGREET